MSRSALPALLAAMALGGCLHESRVQTTFDPPYPEHSTSGDSILGVYVGRVPCDAVDCEKLKVQLVLYRKPDTQAPASYWLGVVGAKGNDRLVTRGQWVVQRGVQDYPQATVYALDANAEASLRYFWRVNEDILLVLDPDMRPRAGDAAWGYMLSRDAAPYGPKTYRFDARKKRFLKVDR